MIEPFLRRFQRRPWLSLTVVFTMGLGIALNVAMFTIVNAVVLRPLPFQDSERIVVLGSARADNPGQLRTMSLTDLADIRRARSFEAIGAWRDWSFRMRTPAGPRSVFASIVTPGFFDTLPVKPLLGRLFHADEDRPGRNLRVLISEGLWREEFRSDPEIVGHAVTLSRAPMGDTAFTIVGVMPDDIGWPPVEETQVWALSSIDEDAGLGRDVRNRRVVARVRPGVSIAAANAELAVIAQGLATAYPATNGGWTARAVPAIEFLLGGTRNLLMAFLVAVVCVALIACANVAGVLLADTVARRREFAVRVAMGATPWTIAALVLAECVSLSLVAGTASVLLAGWIVRGTLALAPAIPRSAESAFDWRVGLFALIVSIACGIAFGLLPALRETRTDVAEALRAERSGSAGARSNALRAVLVAGQLALALVLVSAAAASSGTVVKMLRSDPGFDPRGVVAFFLAPPYDRYASRDSIAAAYRLVQEELGTVSGVRAVASISSVGPLLGGQEDTVYRLAGESPQGARRSANYYNVTPGYFETLGIHLREGRDVTWRDTAASPSIAIVNDVFAAQAFSGTSALGRQVIIDDRPLTIVGVAAGGVKSVTPGAKLQPEIYYPYSQQPRWMTIVVLRTDMELGALAPLIRDRLKQIDPDFVPTQMLPLSERIARSRRQPAFVASVFGVFAACALLLSVVGVYGLVAYSLAQRNREIGIRISLGASARDVLRVSLGRAALAIGCGVIAGLLGAFVAHQALAASVPSVGAVDGRQIAMVTLALMGAGFAAAYIPARRALRIDPVKALRSE